MKWQKPNAIKISFYVPGDVPGTIINDSVEIHVARHVPGRAHEQKWYHCIISEHVTDTW